MLRDKKNKEVMGQEGVSGRNDVLVSQLRAALNGAVIAPSDAAYDEARTVFLGGIDRRPAAIIRAADAADVVQVVALARGTGLETAVRCDGPTPDGPSC